MSTLINPAQLKKLHTLLSQSRMLDNKAELVAHFSGGRVSSSRELKYAEAEQFITHLEAHLNQRDPRAVAKEKHDKMVNKLLYIGYQMGYDQPRTDEQARMDRKVLNKQNVQAWCNSKHCTIHKPINEYTNEELVVVLSQFEMVYKSFKKEYQRNG